MMRFIDDRDHDPRYQFQFMLELTSALVLAQLRSFVDTHTDGSLPMNIYHSSVRDYVSDTSNCSLFQAEHITPYTILAQSSFRLMMQEIPESTALLDALSDLKKQSQATPLLFPQPSLERLLAFIVQPLELL
jgi:hypothetical protein